LIGPNDFWIITFFPQKPSVVVVDTSIDDSKEARQLLEEAKVKRATELLQRTKDSLVGQGVDASKISILTRIAENPQDEIILEAQAQNVDFIIVGSRGRNVVTRALLGSVSNHVVNNAHCSVLVVR